MWITLIFFIYNFEFFPKQFWYLIVQNSLIFGAKIIIYVYILILLIAYILAIYITFIVIAFNRAVGTTWIITFHLRNCKGRLVFNLKCYTSKFLISRFLFQLYIHRKCYEMMLDSSKWQCYKMYFIVASKNK